MSSPTHDPSSAAQGLPCTVKHLSVAVFFSSEIKEEEGKRIMKISVVSFVAAGHGGEVWGCSVL